MEEAHLDHLAFSNICPCSCWLGATRCIAGGGMPTNAIAINTGRKHRKRTRLAFMSDQLAARGRKSRAAARPNEACELAAPAGCPQRRKDHAADVDAVTGRGECGRATAVYADFPGDGRAVENGRAEPKNWLGPMPVTAFGYAPLTSGWVGCSGWGYCVWI